MTDIRLQKWLADAGVCSRRQGERLIQEGRVRVNGRAVTTLGSKIDPAADRVEVDGRHVASDTRLVYIALNKPKGYVTSCRHEGQRVVVELVDLPERIFPVGRLDKDTTGLLLLTNDGPLHHRLSHPSFDHEKEYEVATREPIDDSQLQQMAQGIVLDGRKTRPARVQRVSGRRFRIVLQEGRNRQIRRMVRKLGHQVKRLKRIRVAHIRLGSLPEGGWRFLSPAERKRLLKDVPR